MSAGKIKGSIRGEYKSSLAPGKFCMISMIKHNHAKCILYNKLTLNEIKTEVVIKMSSYPKDSLVKTILKSPRCRGICLKKVVW